jgi:hypothetical protein
VGQTIKLYSLVQVSLVLPMTLLTGCEMTWTDPFASRRVGETFFVPANPDSEFPLSKNSETLSTRATILNLSRASDIPSSRGGASSFGSGEKISLDTITFLGKHQDQIVFTKDQLEKMNDNAECMSITSDIKDMLIMYPNMKLVCGRDFTRIFHESLGISVKTEDGLTRYFTSWASHWSDLGGYRVVIQSLAL